MTMEGLWRTFCGQSNCSKTSSEPCTPTWVFLIQPSSCVSHGSIIFLDALLLVMLLFFVVRRIFSKTIKPSSPRCKTFSTLQILSAAFNGCLAVAYIGLGAWSLEEKLRNDHSIFPIAWWVLLFFHGFTWLLLGLIASLKGDFFPKAELLILSSFAFLSSGLFCFIALFDAIVNKNATLTVLLDIISFVGAIFLLLCTFKGYNNEGQNSYIHLHEDECNGSIQIASSVEITGFAKAGFLSKMSFWWLNPLMKLGKEKTFVEDTVPKLRDSERAGFCYKQFLDQLNKHKQTEPSTIFWMIVECHWRDIMISGFYALLKVLTLSAGPLLLNAFIRVAEGDEGFKNEGCVLAISLFLAKILESLSQRQWYFKTRLIGLKIRSMLIAAIYRKQLRLSSTARMKHSAGEIMNYVTVDAYRIGEFPFWFHQIWTTIIQLCIALVILIQAVGLATISSLVVITLTVLCNSPLAKLQHKFQSKLMVAQDKRLKTISEALVNMKVLKLYAWETYFKNIIEELRKEEYNWLSGVQMRKAYNTFLFWTSPVLVSAATFVSCYFLEIPLHASNVFTYVASLRLVQEPIRLIPDVIGVWIQARVALARIEEFLDAQELNTENVRKKSDWKCIKGRILLKTANVSWEASSSKPTLRNVNLEVRPGEKVAVCGEVGSGKSTLLYAILGEVPHVEGVVEVYGSIAYVSQTAWIQTGTIRENILFGSLMDDIRYQETLRRCALLKDLQLLPYGDLTEIGERGVNLSGGQKQRIQLARALYQDADIYVLDDPFSAVDAHTASNLFTEYVMEALSGKTVLLVTHQVDFLPAFDCCVLMSNGEVLQAGHYQELFASSQEFVNLVKAHKETAGTERLVEVSTPELRKYPAKEIKASYVEKQHETAEAGQLIKREEREVGDSGLRPYLLYLNQNKGYLYFSIVAISHLAFVICQVLQNFWLASGVDNPHVSNLKLIVVYLIFGFCSTFLLLIRSLGVVTLGMKSSISLFTQLLNSLFRAPMSFYDSTPFGRILSRVSSDLNIIDLDLPIYFQIAFGATTLLYSNLVVLAIITWQVLFVSVPMIYIAIRLQQYYFATAKELMRINGTTKSLVANHLAESVAGSTTIRAFEEEERFFAKNLDLIDTNAAPFFYNFAANEWLIQRLEFLSAFVLAAAALFMVLLPPGTFKSGFIGMALTYGLSLNVAMVFSIQNQCTLANYIISVERVNQYMHVPSEAQEVIEDRRPPWNWPSCGKVEIIDLQIRYRPNAPLVLRGISCTFEGGDKIGIVGRTGSGKTTLIGALFRLVEPTGGKIIVDGIDICSVGLHDLRSHFGIIPQDATLFNGTVRFNLDPLSLHSDDELWEVLDKCQLIEVVQDKDFGLDSLVLDDGSNWSMGQRQLFCLGRALLRRSRILVLDEATASIDNATDMILQRTIRKEFADCTVITVAHRIPTVMDCTKVVSISEGKLVEYDEPMKLMKKDDSLFGELVKEYWSHIHSAESH